MNQRTRRSPARFVAPLALIAVGVALLAIVTGSSNNGNASGPLDAGTTQTTKKTGSASTSTGGTTNVTTAKPAGPKSYVVKIGDSLSSIANKTGVPLERLQELNPDVDSHLMTAGQKIRLR